MKFILSILFFLSLQSQAQIIRANPFYTPFASAPASTDTAFVTTTPAGDTRTDDIPFVGYRITVGSMPLTITALGRYVISGNDQSHEIKIVDGSNTTIVTATINCSGLSVGWNYVSITPTTLSASTIYYVFTQENTTDSWFNARAISYNSVVTALYSAYYYGGSLYYDTNGWGYGFPNFKYYR